MDVAPSVASKLRRHGVSAQESRHELPGAFLIQLGDDVQAFQFVGQVQAVTTFDFDRRGAKGKQALESSACRGLQLLFRSSTNLLDRGIDAAATGGDFFIGLALQALFKLIFSHAGED